MRLNLKHTGNKAVINQQVINFEVALPKNQDYSFQVSKKALENTTSAHEPIERKTVMMAATLIQEVMQLMPGTSVKTQANIRKEKVIALLVE